MKVAIIGQGYVGLTIAASAARVGHKVVGLEINHNIAKRLALGESHIEGITSADLKECISAGTYLCVENPAEFANADPANPTPLPRVALFEHSCCSHAFGLLRRRYCDDFCTAGSGIRGSDGR